ncbi:rRNA-binding ribosome biosynthesis protein rpf2 [Chytriomyces hyalinus]|nr:rRNA-binding ribosome biosynthesis protein rpf2 [Chytriomyces hyalinus]
MKKREPMLEENVKMALFIKGSTTSELGMDALKDLYALRRPNAVLFSKKNDLHPFEDPRPVEFLSTKNNSPLLLLASHSKKRPHCLTLMRTFDHQILDMVELLVQRGLPTEAFEGPKPVIGNRPCLVFQGDLWEVDEEFGRIKSSLMDLLGNGNGASNADKVNLKGLDHVICCTVDTDRVVHLRSYMVVLKKSGTKLPKVELQECGPALEMKVGRTQFADATVYKEALRVPKELQQKKVKNIERDEMGDKLGRVHMEKQDLTKLQTRKMKGLKRGRKDEDGEEGEGDEKSAGEPKKQPRARKVSAKKSSSDLLSISDDETTASLTLIQPSSTDYILAASLISVLTLCIYLSRADILLGGAAFVSSLLMATMFIDDTHTIHLDKTRGTVRVTKSKFGQVSRTRVGQIREAVAAHIVEDKISLKRNGWALELEFLNAQGLYYRIRCADTLVVGETKLKMLGTAKRELEEYLGLSTNPFTKDSFKKSAARHL